MISTSPVVEYAHLTLEATAPHGIGQGRGDATHDVILLRDANGLPAIAGSSLAGVLRHLYQQSYGADETDELFGFAQGRAGQVSQVRFTWGLVHGSDNRAVEGLDEDRIGSDDLLDALRSAHPLVRERVRLNARGCAEDAGKFDVTLVPAGARYSSFITRQSDGTRPELWQRLLALMGHPLMRIGCGTRSGSGGFRVVGLHAARWDLRKAADREAYRARPRQRGKLTGLTAHEPSHSAMPPEATLCLRAEAGWRIGGGDEALIRDGKEADLLPQSEQTICWRDDRGSLSAKRPVLPATAVKGAIAHRVAFHARRLTGAYAEAGQPADQDDCPAVRELFGEALDHAGGASGRPGVVFIDDVYLYPDNPSAQVKQQMHNRVDRFTGGVIDGALFCEELLWETQFALSIRIGGGEQRLAQVSDTARQALDWALADLARGWLPIGAGGSRGQGVMIGVGADGYRWSDEGRWIKGRERS